MFSDFSQALRICGKVLNELTYMLPAMNRLCLCVGVLLALSAEAGAQQRDCYTIVMTNSASGGNLGSILLDRCTGNSWVLVRATVSDGASALRWFPISVEKSEAINPVNR